ncbi:hypothetical protein LguiA_034756 [Lonicera macranthoides]
MDGFIAGATIGNFFSSLWIAHQMVMNMVENCESLICSTDGFSCSSQDFFFLL